MNIGRCVSDSIKKIKADKTKTMIQKMSTIYVYNQKKT
jgi:hypothetical protein